MFSTMQRKLYFYIHFDFAIFHDFTGARMSPRRPLCRLTSKLVLSCSSLYSSPPDEMKESQATEINEVQSRVNVGSKVSMVIKTHFLGGLYY